MQASEEEKATGKGSSMEGHIDTPTKPETYNDGPGGKPNNDVTEDNSPADKKPKHTKERGDEISKKLDNKHNLARSIARKVEGKPLKVYRWELTTSTGIKVDKIMANIARRAKKHENGHRAQSSRKLRKRPGAVKRIAKKVWYIYFRYFPPFLLARWILDLSLVGTKATLAFLRDFENSMESTSQPAKSIPDEEKTRAKTSDLGENEDSSSAKTGTCQKTEPVETKPIAESSEEKKPDSHESETTTLDKVAKIASPAKNSSEEWESAISSSGESSASKKSLKSHAEFKYSTVLHHELRKLTSSLLGGLLDCFIEIFTFLVITMSSMSSLIHRWAGVPEFSTSSDCVDKTDLLVRLVGHPEDHEIEKAKDQGAGKSVWLLDRVLEHGFKDVSRIPILNWVFRFLGRSPRIRITAVTITNEAQTNKPGLAEYLVEDPNYVEEEDPDYTPCAGSSSEESLEYIDDSDITLTEDEEENGEKEEDTVKEETEEEEEKQHSEEVAGNAEEKKDVEEQEQDTEKRERRSSCDEENSKTDDFENIGDKVERSNCEKTSKTKEKTVKEHGRESRLKETTRNEQIGEEDNTNDSDGKISLAAQEKSNAQNAMKTETCGDDLSNNKEETARKVSVEVKEKDIKDVNNETSNSQEVTMEVKGEECRGKRDEEGIAKSGEQSIKTMKIKDIEKKADMEKSKEKEKKGNVTSANLHDSRVPISKCVDSKNKVTKDIKTTDTFGSDEDKKAKGLKKGKVDKQVEQGKSSTVTTQIQGEKEASQNENKNTEEKFQGEENLEEIKGNLRPEEKEEKKDKASAVPLHTETDTVKGTDPNVNVKPHEKGDNKDKPMEEGNLPESEMTVHEESETESSQEHLYQPVLSYLASSLCPTLSSPSPETLPHGSLKQPLVTLSENITAKGDGTTKLPPISTIFKSTDPASSGKGESAETVGKDKENEEKINTTDRNVIRTVSEDSKEKKSTSKTTSMTNEEKDLGSNVDPIV